MSLQEKTLAVTEEQLFLPPTSPKYGSILVAELFLERDVQPAGKDKTGSDLWLDMVMKMSTELQAIDRFKENFRNASPELSLQEFETEFNSLLEMYLRTQFQFCLAENGCNKHLQIQPDYFFTVSKDENGLFVSPKDLSKFGDLAKKYIATNPRVGSGLRLIYELIAESLNSKLGVGIVSPSEEYKGYGSDWDVINLLTNDTGKYLICKRVLSTVERRFVHNLFFLLGQNEYSLTDLLEKNPEDLQRLIPTNYLRTNHVQPDGTPEYESLIADPNHFELRQDSSSLFEIACEINIIYSKVFGESLFEDRDIEMYPIINELVEAYLPDLQKLLLARDYRPYYKLMRQMIYHCQALWKSNDIEPIEVETHPYETFSFNDDVYDHLRLVAAGVIFAGFEFVDTNDSFSDLISTYQFDFSQPPGFEIIRKCKTHGMYEGNHCPKCKHSSD